MTIADPPPAHDLEPALPPDCNAADLRYLQEASAALLPIMAASDAAASRGTTNGVRVLAHEALAVQTGQLEAISSCLLAWGRPDSARPNITRSEALAGLHGHDLDQAFGDRLAAHARASITAARAELITGASHSARPIAENAIRAQYRQLALLDRLRSGRRTA